MWSWSERVDAMMTALAESPEVDLRVGRRGEPVTDEAIAAVHRAIRFELDPRFLEFFRVCDGLEVIWVSRRLARRDAPVDHFLAHEATGMAGRIHVPSLRAIFLDGPGDKFGPDEVEPEEYTEACLGGWDAHALRAALRDLDDYLAAPDYPSYFIPALVASRRYPDPPVVLGSDHGACFEDNHPMLARDYLALIVATLGLQAPRLRRLRGRGFGGNHALFVAPEGWLDGAPSARELLAAIHGDAAAAEVQAVRARIDAIVDAPGQPVAETPYADYNAAPAGA